MSIRRRGAAMDNKERREAKRISHLCEVECKGADVGRLATRINDLSMTGAFIDSIATYPPGTILKLRFHVKQVLIETTAEVRYSMPKAGMGVRFMDLTEENSAALENLIEGRPLDSPTSSRHKPAPAGSDMLSGSFSVVSMFDVIQIIENNRLGGALAVLSPAVDGAIQFNDGHIVGAYAGTKTGLEALKRFMDVTEGTFEFKRATLPFAAEIRYPSNMALMMDLVRVKDEESLHG